MLSRFVNKFKNKKSEKVLKKLLSNDKIEELESRMGCKIKNKNLFIQALVHRSYLEESEELTISNERLEFLGDAILSLIVAEYLYSHFPEKDEGFLTKVRAKVVNRTALANAAESLDLSSFIIIGKNLSLSFKNGARTVLSDALEAIVGAVYLDSGLDITKKFINRILIKPVSRDDDFLLDENFKSQLLEYAQSKRMDNPIYVVIDEKGPQHNRVFTVKVLIGRDEYGIGQGKNKKSAEQDAAKAAMIKIMDESI